jgi:serine/threonine protein kinase
MLGERISHYRVTGKLGVGGMGVVYEAEDTRLGRPVALKFLPDELSSDADAVRRFEREAQTIALLSHPHICTIYDLGQSHGRSFIAMERCDGISLKAYMSRRTLETPEIVDIALQITEALAAAHDKGIVHRDIKPGNIVVNDARQVKVLDFGLARRFRIPDTGQLGPDGSTIIGRPLGTANYMAPERILQMPLDPRSDLFSLGVVMYEMATARLPFAGASPAETVTNIFEKEPPPIRTLVATRPAALEAIIARLIAKRAEDRFQSAAELCDALKGLTKKTMWQRLLRR